MRIALVVPGRFHAFDLARGLAARGHDVTVLTNYPAWAASRFDLGGATVRSCGWQGAAGRLLARAPRVLGSERSDAWMSRWFGRWAARVLAGGEWDLIHCWSGVSEELLASSSVRAHCRWLMRGSSHIAVQDRLLREEEQRARTRLDRPSAWMIARERREYALADRIVVLSTFARRSFEDEGVPADRLLTVPLGVEIDAFRVPPDAVGRRLQRICAGAPLRVLYAGALTLRKGLWDLATALERLDDVPLDVRVIGGETPEAQTALTRLAGRARRLGHVPQADLPAHYWDADVFVFPTIEDGFGMVLTQAQAAGLPVIATDHCAAPDLVQDGVTGWLVPARAPEALAARLRWCHEHRDALADMASRVSCSAVPRDWGRVAGQLADLAVACAKPTTMKADDARA
jgi:glycosyltransferase involved in cell wall biosynthesis